MTDLLPAAVEAGEVRARMRQEAARTREAARGWFAGDCSPMTGLPGPGTGRQLAAPPPKVKVADWVFGGRTRWIRAGGGEWDWLEQVPADELRRLTRRGWFDKASTITPDELGRCLNLPIDDAAGEWRRHASLADAAAVVATGQMFGRGHLVGLADVCPVLAGEGWDLVALLDPATAERETAERSEREAGNFADRELCGGWQHSTGRNGYRAELGPAPWRMTAESFRAELLDVEHRLARLDDPGPDDAARWFELVPLDSGGCDPDGAPLPAEALHALMVDLATLAGYPVDPGPADQAPAGPDPVGAVEIAERLQVQRPTVDQWRQRAIGFPSARWTVGGRPAWEWADIARWAKTTNRLPMEAP